jgi:hypothetical protein
MYLVVTLVYGAFLFVHFIRARNYRQAICLKEISHIRYELGNLNICKQLGHAIHRWVDDVKIFKKKLGESTESACEMAFTLPLDIILAILFLPT